ncbi:hypothetical protein A6A40_23300 (plasmid) [Azospirillum humicireducens]|uniref:Uncharacterized protein n=1 Tax=Azospirillum humicireducens TaxID=1226968 RepID=A0A2R4VU46_9PROT|nr:hypothetical protein [Azospirillum humicireducens]AWB07970.1 hypothetical protein A6A40_23300 [Azospirillum humicireducens]
MTDEEFRDQLDRHGGDLALWPADAARDARRLLLRSVKAQAMLDEMVTMELALGRSEDRPPPGLADRIFAAAFRLPQSDRGFDEDGDQPPRLM